MRVEREVSVIDSSGFPQVEWQSIGEFWAAVEPLSARELLASQQVNSEVRTRIVMRFNAQVVPSMRIVHNETIYNIAGVQPDPNSGQEWMTLPVTTGVDEG